MHKSGYIVPAGGLTPAGSRWIAPSNRFFLPVRALSRVFRGKFTAGLQQLFQQHKLQFHGSLQSLAEPRRFHAFLRLLFRENWVVYAKPPFGGPEHVLHYLARYTHRVAISNHWLVAFQNDRVSFRWKDYARGGKQKIMTVSADEFLRRFLIHVLPQRLVRISADRTAASAQGRARRINIPASGGIRPRPVAVQVPARSGGYCLVKPPYEQSNVLPTSRFRALSRCAVALGLPRTPNSQQAATVERRGARTTSVLSKPLSSRYWAC